MAVPNRVYAATGSKGVYRCGAFTASGDQPVWAAYNTGLAATTPTAFCLDRSASPWDARMFCIQGGDLYRRVAGGDWAVVLTAAEAIALTQAGQDMKSVITDPVTGYVYVPTYGKPGENDRSSVYLLRSIDHGDNWTATTIATYLIAVYNMSNVDAYDSAVAFAYVRAIATSEKVCYSVNDGTSWTEVGVSATGALPGDHVRVHPASGIIYGLSWDSDYDVFRLDPTTGAVSYPAGGNGAGPYGGSLWCDPDDADHAATFYRNFRETSDDWATLATDQDMNDNYREIARGCEDDCWVHGRINNGAAVAVSTNGYTLSHRSGANYDSSPYTDSIPTDCGGIIECGLWTVFDPPSAGPTPPGTIITVGGTPITLVGPGLYQAVSMPGHTGIDRGIPMPGDRAAWDETEYGSLHARDIQEEKFLHHIDPDNPPPHNLSELDDVDTTGKVDGDALLYSETTDKWEPSDVLTPDEHTAIGNGAPHHAAVTLGGGNDAALALSGQELTLTLPEDSGGVDEDARRLIWMGW